MSLGPYFNLTCKTSYFGGDRLLGLKRHLGRSLVRRGYSTEPYPPLSIPEFPKPEAVVAYHNLVA
jgi:hypothetical protein